MSKTFDKVYNLYKWDIIAHFSAHKHIRSENEKIAPFKDELEICYQSNRSFQLDIKLIFLTKWVILFPKSNL